MKQQSPMLRLWELGEGQQGGLKRAVLSAVVGGYCLGCSPTLPWLRSFSAYCLETRNPRST